MSPYIFILCMEVLGYLVDDKCQFKLQDPVKASKGGPTISHLFFVDDLILFAKVDEKNFQSIWEVLEVFGELSGQKVSASKSKVFFSPNVLDDTRFSLSNILGFHSTPNLGKYLGFPLKHTGSSSQDYNFIIEKVQKKLAGWKASLLSFTGRVVLAQATTTAIPSYVMQRVALPSKVLNSLDKLNRDFILGSSQEKKRLPNQKM